MIGAGYNTCEDYNFRAVDLFAALEPKMEEEKKKNGEFTPQVHLGIKSFREFVETFMYYFVHESNAEVVVANNEMYKEVLDIIQRHVSYEHYVGGHSAVFCQRA